MAVTTNYGFPKPAGTDSPAGNVQIGALADALDTLLAKYRPQISNQVNDSGYGTTGAMTSFGPVNWPAPSVLVPPSGIVRASISAYVANTNTATSTIHIGWQAQYGPMSGGYATGAIVVPASVGTAVSSMSSLVQATHTRFLTGLTPGLIIAIVPKYQISSGSAATASCGWGVLTLEPIL